MSAPSYYTIMESVRDALRASSFIPAGWSVGLDAALPTAEDSPAIRVLIPSARIVPTRLAGGVPASQPDDELVRCEIRCYAFSAEAPDDAYRVADLGQQAVRQALEHNRTVTQAGGVIHLAQVQDVRFDWGQSPGLFCVAIVGYDLRVRS